MKTDRTSFEEALEEFSHYLIDSKKSPKTQRAYRRDLIILSEGLSCQEPVRDWNEVFGHLESKLKMNENESQNTRNRRLSSLKRFVNFLRKEEYVKNEYHYTASHVPMDISRCAIKEEDYFKLLDVLPEKNLSVARTRAMISLGYWEGLTSGEVSIIKYEDFSRENDCITTLGVESGRKYRILQVSECTRKELEAYEPFYHDLRADRKSQENLSELKPEEMIFYFKNRFGNRISQRYINKDFVNLLKRASLNNQLVFSSLRYAYIQRIFKSGASDEDAVQILGMKNMNNVRALRKHLCY